MRIRYKLLAIFISSGLLIGLLELTVNQVTVSPTMFLSNRQRALFDDLIGQPIILAWISVLIDPIPASIKPVITASRFQFSWRQLAYTVTLTEKEPVFLVVDQRVTRAIAADGTVLNTELDSPNQTDPDIMIVSGYTAPAQYLTSDKLKALQSLKDQLSLYPELGTLRVDRVHPEDYILYYNDITPIKLGNITNLSDKFRALTVFLNQYSGDYAKLRHIDLRYPNHVVIQRY